MMNKTKIIIISLVVCAISVFSAQAQNLLLNGSFESPAIPANTIAIASPASWQGNASTRIINGNYSIPGLPGPQDGQQYVSIGNDGAQATISQTFNIADPGTYVLTWFDSAGNVPGSTSPYSVTVLNGGSVLSNRDLVIIGNAVWVSRSMQLNLTSGTYTLRFSSRQPTPGGLSTQLDNVSLPSPANNVPVAADQSVTTDQDTPKDITLSATDTDGDPLTFQIVTPPANGTVTGTPPDVTYTPNSSYTGLDTFTFKANDGQDDSNVATVVVDVRNLCQPGTVFHNVLLPEVVLDIPSFKNPPVQLRFAPLGLEFTVRTASEADALCEALSNVGTLTMGVRRMSTGGSFLDRFIGYSTGQATLTLFNNGQVRWHTPGFDVIGTVRGVPVPGGGFCSTGELTEWATPAELGFSPLDVPFEQTVRAAESLFHLRLSERMKNRLCVRFLVVADPGAAELLTTDATGKQTGRTSSGKIVEDIPGSAYFYSSSDPLVIIFAPNEETYTTEVRGYDNGTYSLAIGVVDFVNHPVAETFSGPIADGLSIFYSTILDLDSNTAVTDLSLGPSVESLGAYVNSLFQAGTITNRGIANSLGRTLATAQKQSIPLNAPALRGVMAAFLNEVQAQRGKHINAAAADSLSATAEFLIHSIRP